MADGPASTIVFDGDSTGAVAALHAVDVAAKRTAASIKDTGNALGGMGDGADAGVNKAVAATSRFEAQLKRLNLELESGGRNTAAYIEGRAKLAGADTAALAPLIAQYDQIKAKQAIANSEFTKAGRVMTEYGMTVKGTSAALRQVPAQFTDIIVSLQGGQAPLTVLLQQGGQLKDVFGGVGNAARALGGYILGLVNPFTVVAGTVGVVGLAAYRASEDVKALRTALIMAGTQSTTSLSSLDATAAGLNKLGVSTATSSEALVAFIGAGAKVDSRLQDITKTAIDLEKFGGAAVAETAKKFVALAKDPLADFDRLTLATYSQIEALLEQGKRTEAVALAQEAFNTANKETAKALAASVGPLDVATAAWKSYAAAIWDSVKAAAAAAAGAFSPQTGDQERADLQKRRDLYAAQGYDTTKEDARLAYFKQIDAAQKGQNANLTKELELKNLLAKFNEQDTAGKKQRELNQGVTDYSKLLAAGQISVEQYTAAIKKLSEVKEAKASKPGLSEAEKANAAAVKADIAGAKEMEALRQKALGTEMKAVADLAEAKAKAFAKSAEAYGKELDARAIANADQEKSAYAYVQSVEEGIKRTEFEISLMGQTEQARAIALGQYEIELRLQKQILEVKKSIADESVKDQAIASLNATAIREKSAVANRVMVDEFKKTSEQINSTLTDALMRGFESGKGFARNLRDTVVNMFKTMVLRPIISAVMSPISGAITGAMGLSGAASAATGVAGGAATGLAGTLAGFAATAASWGTAAGAGFMATLGGSTIAGGGAAGILATGGAAGASTAGSIGAAAPYALAAVAALAAFGAFRTTKKVGEGITGTLGGDNQSLNSFEEMRKSGYLFGGPKYWDELKALDATMAKAINTDFDAIKTAAKGAASALGLSADSVDGFSKAIRLTFTGDKTKDEALYNDLMSGVSDDLARTIIGSYKETVTTVIDEITSGSGSGPWWDGDQITNKVERQVKTSTYTPSEFARDGETASQTLQRLATSITLVNGTSDMLGNKLTEVGLKGANTASLLIDAFGGAERYAAQMGAYYQNFYTQEEQRAKLIENTSEAFTALGKTMPVLDGGARAAYRSMVELAAGQDMSVESNRTAYASLLALQGPMNELAPTFDAVADAAPKSTEAISDFAANMQKVTDGLVSTGKGLQDQFDKLALSDADYRAKQIAGMTALQVAQYDTNASLQASIDAFGATAAAAEKEASRLQAVADQRYSLETALLQAQGNTTALRERELAAIDPSNRALQESIYAIEDATAAQDKYNTALGNAESRLASATTSLNAAQSAVDAVREKATGAYLTAQESVATAQQRIADITAKSMQDASKAAYDSAQKMRDLGKSLKEFVGGETFTPSQNFKSLLTKALSGDAEAMQGLTGAASAAADSAKATSNTSADARLATAKIMADVMRVANLASSTALPALAGETDPMVVATEALTKAQQEMAAAYSVTNAIGASTTRTVQDLIVQYTVAQTSLITAQAEFAASKQVLNDIKKNTGDTNSSVGSLKERFTLELALAATTSVTDYLTVEATALTVAQRDTALAVLDGVTRTIGLVADKLTESERDTALTALVGVSRTVKIVAEELTGSQATAALAVLDGVTKTVSLSVTSLTGTQRDAAITVLDNVSKSVGLTATSLTGAQASAALSVLDGITKTVDLAITSLTATERNAALTALDGVTKAIGLAATAITPAQAATALSTLDGLSKAVALTVSKFSTADDEIIRNASAAVTKTVTAALGTGNSDALTLAKAYSDTITRTLTASGGTLTADQKAILSAVASGSSTVTLSVSGTVAGGTITFAADDPIRSVFNNIGKTNALLIDSQQLFLTQLLGVGIDENLQKQGTQDQAFVGTYTLQSQSRDYLSLIATESYNTNVNLLNGIKIKFDRGTASGTAGGSVFATGGAFTNSIVSKPTAFNMGQMGEAGPEAIMPLTNINGSLGVRFAGSNSNDVLVGEIRGLREENAAQARAMVQMQQRLTKLMERWDGTGMPETRVVA